MTWMASVFGRALRIRSGLVSSSKCEESPPPPCLALSLSLGSAVCPASNRLPLRLLLSHVAPCCSCRADGVTRACNFPIPVKNDFAPGREWHQAILHAEGDHGALSESSSADTGLNASPGDQVCVPHGQHLFSWTECRSRLVPRMPSKAFLLPLVEMRRPTRRCEVL